jgi:peroxiredoxin Q/BCP
MSGKSRTRQQRRQAPQGPQAQDHASRPAGNGQAPGQRPATTAAQRKAAAAERRAKVAAARQAQRRAARRRKTGVRAAIAAAAAGLIVGLFVIFSGASQSGASTYPYQVGSPGLGKTAPGFMLTASTGGRISLSQYRGKSVLLFFQEGLTCQPCWDQIADLQHGAAQLRAAGISDVVSITTDPAGAIAQKARDMHLTIPVLSDPNLAVSQAYHANGYGMMGNSRDGHTFILIGPDGKIRWRADYGGAPKYIMYLPTTSLLANIKAGEHPA